MAVGDFSIIKEGEIIGGDYFGAEFGAVWTSFRDYVCAIRDKKKIVLLNNVEVEYFVPLRAKGISKGTSNLIEATVHGVLSTVIPGGALLGNAAAAAAGIASRSAVTHAAGGIRNYRDVLVVFRDGKKALIRCADLYVKKIRKSCSRRKLTENEIDSIINGKKEVAPKVALRDSSSECEEELDLRCKVCHEKISASDKFCSHCGAKTLSETGQKY